MTYADPTQPSPQSGEGDNREIYSPPLIEGRERVGCVSPVFYREPPNNSDGHGIDTEEKAVKHLLGVSNLDSACVKSRFDTPGNHLNMANITIYKRQYTLPTLATDRFAQLQNRIRERQQMIQQGKRARQIEESYHETLPPEQAESVGLLGRIFGRTPAPQSRTVTRTRTKTQFQELSVDDRFSVMKELMAEYVAMLGMLDTHKVEYDRLLAQIGDDIRQVAAEKCAKIVQHDDRLTRLAQQAADIEDAGAAQMILSQQAQLVQSVRLLGQAMLLITKKLDLFQAALQKIDTDQELKRGLLDKKVKQLGLRYELYLSQKDIYELQKEVSDMLRVALNFEELMRECFGPLQALIEDVTGMDGAFAGAVEEIKNLTRVMLTDDSGALAADALNDAEEDLLNFLMRSQLQRDQLADVVNSAWQAEAEAEFDADMAQGEAVSVRQALENLRTFLDARLPVNSEASQSGASNLDLTAQSRLRTPVVELGGGVTLELIEIPGGTFWMGSPDGQGSNDERPRHQVTLAPFYIGKYPVTQAQWQAVMGSNPSYFKGEDRPVEQVSWNACQEFLKKLNANPSLSPLNQGGQRGVFRLPTEAEWEYACRAGSETIYAFGDDPAQLGTYAWFSENSGSETHPVGQKSPNAWGLCDMHGNVLEWCQDWFAETYYANSPQENPQGPSSGQYRLLRGGSWYYNATRCRSACRNGSDPANRNRNLGVRVLARTH